MQHFFLPDFYHPNNNTMIYRIISTWVLALMITSTVLAQGDKTQLFAVHEDIVKPSMTAKYESTAKALRDLLAEHNEDELTYMTVQTDDNRYLYLSTLENYGQMDNNVWADISEAAGDELGEVFKGFDGCYDSHWNYTLRLNHDLSYDSEGINNDDKLFRHFTWYYIDPSMESEAHAVAKEWKELFASKGVKQSYRIYQSDMGMHSPMYIVIQQAKDQASWLKESEAATKALGEDGAKLSARTAALCNKIEEFNGYMRPDLAYMGGGK